MSVIKSQEERSNIIYIAGPMTGLEEFNFPAFDAAAAKFEELGYEVKNPAEHGVVEGATWEDYMAFDLTQLGQCGAIYMLNGWQMSRGACLEQLIAERLGMKVIYEDRV